MWQLCCSKLKQHAGWVIPIHQGHHYHVDGTMILNQLLVFMNMLIVLYSYGTIFNI